MNELWVCLCRVGVFDLPNQPPFEITEAMLHEMAANFGASMAVDVEFAHSTSLSPLFPMLPPVRLVEVGVRRGEQGLYLAGKLQMPAVSPAVLLDACDRATGERHGAKIVAVSFVNEPVNPRVCAEATLSPPTVDDLRRMVDPRKS